MRKKIVAGNWKMNATPAEGVELFKGVAAKKGEVCSCVNFIVAPPFTHLSEIVKAARGTGFAVSAQNCAAEAKGAYTGEVSAKMIASLGVEYVILGHSERREYYGETSQTLNKKMARGPRGRQTLRRRTCPDRRSGLQPDARAVLETDRRIRTGMGHRYGQDGYGRSGTGDARLHPSGARREVRQRGRPDRYPLRRQREAGQRSRAFLERGRRRRPDRRRGARGRRLHRDRQGIQVSRSIYRIRPEPDGGLL